MTEKEMRTWIEGLKEDLREMEQCKGASEQELNEMVLDGLFDGFQQGELHRLDLALAARILGIEVDQEFMNDPHPDPIDLKKDQ